MNVMRRLSCSALQRGSFKRIDEVFDLEAKPELRQLERNPMPRDGHAAVVLFNSLFIFGGDRHRMPFNDLLILPLSHLV